MATKKEENIVKQGISNKNIFWINMKAYELLYDNSIILSAGGKEIETETELIKSFISRNKKVHHKYTL